MGLLVRKKLNAMGKILPTALWFGNSFIKVIKVLWMFLLAKKNKSIHIQNTCGGAMIFYYILKVYVAEKNVNVMQENVLFVIFWMFLRLKFDEPFKNNIFINFIFDAREFIYCLIIFHNT